MKSFMKNLGYWIVNTSKTYALTLGLILVISVIQGLGEENVLEYVLTELPMYFFLLAILLSFISSMTNTMSIYPIVLSFNQKRDITALSLSVSNYLLTIVMVVLGCVSLIIGEPDSLEMIIEYIPAIIGGTLLINSLGNIFSLCVIRYSRTVAMVIYFVLVIVVSGGIGAIIGLESSGVGILGRVFLIIGTQNIVSITIWLICLVGVLIYALTTWILCRVTRNVEIKYC